MGEVTCILSDMFRYFIIMGGWVVGGWVVTGWLALVLSHVEVGKRRYM